MIPVQLLSEPIDAEVYMNNKFMGRTPTLTTVPEGKYSFIFRKENYIEVFKEKDIRNQTTVNAKMKMTGEYKKLLAAQSGKSPFPWIKFVGGVVLAGGAAAAAVILGAADSDAGTPAGGDGDVVDDTLIGEPPGPPN